MSKNSLSPMKIEKEYLSANTTPPISKILHDLDAGTINDIIKLLTVCDLKSFNEDDAKTMLLTFHLHTSAKHILTSIDKKFWELCFNQELWPVQKYTGIESLCSIVECWLETPFSKSLNTPPEFVDVKFLLSIISQWLQVFSTPSRNPIKEKSATDSRINQARCVVQSMSTSCQTNTTQMIKRLCNKLGATLERFHLMAGLFRERNAEHGLYFKEPACGSPEKQMASLKTFDEFTANVIAEQLTLQDMTLFLNMLPSDCLNYVRKRPALTVEPTIQQFNRVYSLVVTTILDNRSTKQAQMAAAIDNATSLSTLTLPMTFIPSQFLLNFDQNDQQTSTHNNVFGSTTKLAFRDDFLLSSSEARAQILAKWVTVAAELRQLRSFSAFKAVLTAIQGSAIAGLRETWHHFKIHFPNHHKTLESLSELLNLENNQQNVRELLEHCFSSAELDRQQSGRHFVIPSIFRRKPCLEHNQNDESLMRTRGTIPYLGLFLNDLAMLNESAADWIDKKDGKKLGTSHLRVSASFSADSSPTDSSSLTDQRSNTCTPSSRPLHSRLMQEAPPIPVRAHRTLRMQPLPAANDNRHHSKIDSNGKRVVPLRRLRPGSNDSSRISTMSLEVPTVRCKSSVVRNRSPSRNNSTSSTKTVDIEERLINFRKHRREYAILTKLIAIQKSATLYRLTEDYSFTAWFNSLNLLSEKEANQRSNELEPLKMKPRKSSSMTMSMPNSANRSPESSPSSIPSLSPDAQTGNHLIRDTNFSKPPSSASTTGSQRENQKPKVCPQTRTSFRQPRKNGRNRSLSDEFGTLPESMFLFGNEEVRTNSNEYKTESRNLRNSPDESSTFLKRLHDRKQTWSSRHLHHHHPPGEIDVNTEQLHNSASSDDVLREMRF